MLLNISKKSEKNNVKAQSGIPNSGYKNCKHEIQIKKCVTFVTNAVYLYTQISAL